VVKRSRFQLFGDCMNTAARMESTSLPGRIQLSEDSAELIRRAGKGIWLQKREDLIDIKGKGRLSTYWLNHSEARSVSAESVRETGQANQEIALLSNNIKSHLILDSRTLRLINWNNENLLRLIKQIVARRNALTKKTSKGCIKGDIDQDRVAIN
jgi:Adenylate and Guanylate cyclase catalytic domain